MAIMLDERPIGEVILKNINMAKWHRTLGIHLQNDSIKNKGYGMRSEILALQFAFNELNMEVLYADAIKKNKRSQHVLSKAGFQETNADNDYIYCRCNKSAWKPPKQSEPITGIIIAHLYLKRNKIFILLRLFCFLIGLQ